MKNPKPIYYAALGFFIGSWALGAENNVLKLDDVRQEVLAHNPAVQAAQSRAQARKDAVSLERTLPAPEVSYERWGIGAGEAAEENWYGIRQKFPFPTKFSRRARSAEHEARAEAYHAIGTERDLLLEADKAYFDLFLYSQALPLMQENINLLRRFLGSGNAKYATGQIAQTDLIRAQTELTKLLNQQITLEQERVSTELTLKTLMNHAFEDALGIPEAPVLRELPKIKALEEWALGHRPEVKAAEHHIEHFQADRAVAKQEYVPDFEIRYAYRERPLGEDDSFIMAGIELPFVWFSRPRALNRIAEQRLTEAQASLASLQLETRAALWKAWTAAETARRSVVLIETTLIPQARQAQNTMEKAYTTGHARFLEWLDTQRVRLDAELEWVTQLRTYGQGVADLERLLGNRLTEIADEK
jgi:outer membrane protein TolC